LRHLHGHQRSDLRDSLSLLIFSGELIAYLSYGIGLVLFSVATF